MSLRENHLVGRVLCNRHRTEHPMTQQDKVGEKKTANQRSY